MACKVVEKRGEGKGGTPRTESVSLRSTHVVRQGKKKKEKEGPTLSCFSSLRPGESLEEGKKKKGRRPATLSSCCVTVQGRGKKRRTNGAVRVVAFYAETWKKRKRERKEDGTTLGPFYVGEGERASTAYASSQCM